MDRSEHDEQKALFDWSYITDPDIRDILDDMFAIANGGHRHITVAKKLKAEGVKAGIPDIFLPVARGGYHGLFIEMKTKTGRTTSIQDRRITRLRNNGYRVVVCHGVDSAIDVIIGYLGV